MVEIEISNKDYLRQSKESALVNLSLIKATLEDSQELKEKPNDRLEGAIKNLNFINRVVSPAVENFFNVSGKKIVFNYFTLSLEGSRPFIYGSKDVPSALSYSTAPGRKHMPLNEEWITRMWRSGVNVSAVEALGKLSKEEIIEKFKKQISSSF